MWDTEGGEKGGGTGYSEGGQEVNGRPSERKEIEREWERRERERQGEKRESKKEGWRDGGGKKRKRVGGKREVGRKGEEQTFFCYHWNSDDTHFKCGAGSLAKLCALFACCTALKTHSTI